VVLGHERCIPPGPFEIVLNVTFTGKEVLDLLPLIGANEPLGANSLTSDGGLEQCDL
jgi:hypothetical protein